MTNSTNFTVSTNLYNHYVPSVPAAIGAAFIFAILTILHLSMMLKSKPKRNFTTPFILGGLFEVLGFLARAVSHYHLDSLRIYIIQVLLILLAPILLAASVYMFLGHLMTVADGQQYSPVRVKWLSEIFLLGDWACFQVQFVGASWLLHAKSASTTQNAQNIILAGLALQILCFVLFLSVAVVWQLRVCSLPLWELCKEEGLPLGRTLLSLYSVGVLITFRNIYRFAEYQGDTDGYLSSREWPAYIFNAFFMAIVMMIALFWYTIELHPQGRQQGHHL